MIAADVPSGSNGRQKAIRTTPHPCGLCGRDDSEFLFHAKDRLHGCEGLFTYVRCRSCGLVYMNPQIVPEDLPKVYPANYSPHQTCRGKRRDRRALTAVVRKAPFVSRICARFGRDSRLLDVGCGNGAFLHAIRSVTGCEVCGVDFSEAAVAAAKQAYGIEVFGGTLTEALFPRESFDAITAWWYLEHVPNPREVLDKAYELLKPEGRCILSVPNVTSFNARVFRDRWYHLDCPRHLYLYSPATISAFLQRAGFAVEGITFDANPRGFLQSLRYHFGTDGTPLSQRRNPPGFHLMKAVARPWTKFVAMLRQADLIIVCARKRNDGTPDKNPS